MKTTTEMQLVPIAKLVPYVNNARTHSPEQITKLRSSLREFGFINPVIIDRDFNVIAGHGRILAAKEESITEVPCVFADHLSEAQKKAYIIADNRMAMDAGWDEELLRVEIESLQGMDFDPLLTGFDEKELAALFDDGMEAKEDDFDVDAELQKPAFSRLGDVWTLGRHRLVCGDSTKAETYTTLMDGVKANLVITDPPYNVNYKDGSIKNDNMDEGSFEDFLQNAFLAMFESMRLGAAAYIFHADSEGLAFRRAFRDAGFKLAECLIWEKNSFVLGRQDYQWRHEPILYGWKEGAAHYFIDDRSQDTILLEDELDLESMKKEDLITYINQIIAQYKDQTTVLFEKKPTKNDVHPTMKPVNLVGRLMRNSSKPGWNVLDLFGGSGSTLMAAEQIGRRAFLMELDEKFCDVIVHRWEEFTGKKAVRAGKLEVSL